MDLIPQLHFLRPAWLLALPPLWVAVVWLARRRSRDGQWSQLIDSELLPALQLDGGDTRSRSPWPWLLAAWTFAAVALAGPSWERAQAPAWRGNDAWVVVLDLSPSMATSDVTPDRTTRARYAIDDLLGVARDTRVGLVVFGDEAFTVAPLTDDVATIRGLLPPLAPDILPTTGDHLAPALDAAGKLLAQGNNGHGRVVVLSDGFADSTAAFDAARQLGKQGIDVDVIGVGAKGLDTDQLQQLASSGHGRYTSLDALPAEVARLQQDESHTAMAAANAGPGVKVAHRLDGGFWLLPPLLLLAALLSRRGWL